MNYTYEHLEEQEEAHLAWTKREQEKWRKWVRGSEITQSILTWGFGIAGLILLFVMGHPKNIAMALVCAVASAAFNMLWSIIIESAQEGLKFMIECQGRSEQSLEDIRRLKREWRGY